MKWVYVASLYHDNYSILIDLLPIKSDSLEYVDIPKTSHRRIQNSYYQDPIIFKFTWFYGIVFHHTRFWYPNFKYNVDFIEIHIWLFSSLLIPIAFLNVKLTSRVAVETLNYEKSGIIIRGSYWDSNPETLLYKAGALS